LNALVRPTVIVGLFIQQVIALFVLKTGAGYSIFNWIATAASDLLNCGHTGAKFFFDEETINKGWFFVNVLASIIFFIALVQMFYYVRTSFDPGDRVIHVTTSARRYAMAY
jgi:CNT family concentrative nucleoside transporter